MKLVLIPKGKFLMGSPATEKERERDYRGSEEQHEVAITQPFYLGVCPVTQKQYRQVMSTNPSWFSASGGGHDKVAGLDTDDFPVEQVSWKEAVAFCRRLSALPAEKRARRVYRLPTEAEWEYSCRGGASSSTPFHFGRSLSSTQANFNGRFPYGAGAVDRYLGRPCDVGSYEPNPFGLYDMHGNVWQWCADRFDPGYYSRSPRKDPKGPSTGRARVLRGGSWAHHGHHSRSACRGAGGPVSRGDCVGFRIACSLPPRTP
jgi:formylglycine-generating enzyme required for sulfatase activity